MDKNSAKQLIERYLSGTCTPEEKAIVERAYNEIPIKREARGEQFYTQFSTDVWMKLSADRQLRQKKKWERRFSYAAAAILLIVMGVSYLFMKQAPNPPNSALVKPILDVDPGTNKGMLILADGRKVPLGASNSAQMVQGHAKITIKSGEVVYSPENSSYEDQNVVNTIVTPKGGQFQLTLSDGTKVKLNAASTLTYAPTFTGQKDRKVRLSGEAYFDVAHDSRHPFIVETQKQSVKVLGTRFNIKSYPEENAVTTSLLAGKVQISTALDPSKTLIPGQAAITEGKTTRIAAIDEYAVSWTEGQIRFKDADLKSILLPVSRWYDLKVIYEREPSAELYTGGILKSNKLSTFLNILDSRNVKYELRNGREGKELIIK